MDDIIIQTPRLYLRSIKPGDEAIIFPEIDEELTKYWIGWEPPKDVEAAKSAIEKSIALSKTTINVDLVALGANDNFIGKCGIVLHMFANEVVLDLCVNHSAQGQGYATEMLLALINWAKKNLKLPYIIYSVTDGNAPSESIIKKLGAPLHREYTALKRNEQKLVRDYKIVL